MSGSRRWFHFEPPNLFQTTNTNSVALRDDVAERSTREYVDRCQQLSETMDRMFSVAQKISPSFPSIDLLDSGTDESIRRLSSDQATSLIISLLANIGCFCDFEFLLWITEIIFLINAKYCVRIFSVLEN